MSLLTAGNNDVIERGFRQAQHKDFRGCGGFSRIEPVQLMKGVNKSRRFRFPIQGLNRSIILPISTLGSVVLMFFLSFGCESVNFFNWQGIRPEIRDTVKLIEQYGSVTSKAVGPAGKTPRQWYV